jgi:FkbM family methyltransferase
VEGEAILKLWTFGKWNKGKHVAQLTEWETDEVIFRKEISKVKEGWIVLDVGSEFGYYAIKAGLLVGNKGKVLAIEPHPETSKLLRMNIKLYELGNHVFVVQKAVSKEAGKAKLYETVSPGSTSILPRQSLFKLNKSRLYIWLDLIKSYTFFNIIHKRYAPIKYEVPMDTLEGIAKECGLGKIDLIKIDVEGAELNVLKGSYDMLKKDMPILLVEVHFGQNWKPETFYESLRKLGYNLTIDKRSNKALVIARPKKNSAKN